MSRGLRLQDLAFLGRVGNAGVTPLSFPGLHRWYKADSYTGIANDGDSVGGGGAMHGPWVDQTGSGDDATGLAIFRTNQVGTQPWLQFTPNFEFLPGVLNDFTILFLGKTTAGQNSFLFYNFSNGYQIRQIFFGIHEVIFYAGGANVTSNVFPGNDFEVVEIKRSAGNITFRQNQTARGGGVDANPWTVHQLGSSSGAGNTINVGEILIYNTVLSTTNVDQLYNEYLKPKWVTLP